MTELIRNVQNLPSGYAETMHIDEKVVLGKNVLPWLTGPDYEVNVVDCTLQSGKHFLLASAVGSHPALIDAAMSLDRVQNNAVNNMFYSRIPEIAEKGYSPSVDSVPNPITPYSLMVMRNPAGQRVYFARLLIGSILEDQYGPTIVRLAVCDKNKQAKVMNVLSGMSERTKRQRNQRGSN